MGRSGSGLWVSTPLPGGTAEFSGALVGSLQAVKSQSPAEFAPVHLCGRRGLWPSWGPVPSRPPPSCTWVVQRRGLRLLSSESAFSQGCENQDTFPWGLLCPIKLKQINLADGIPAPTGPNLFTSPAPTSLPLPAGQRGSCSPAPGRKPPPPATLISHLSPPHSCSRSPHQSILSTAPQLPPGPHSLQQLHFVPPGALTP